MISFATEFPVSPVHSSLSFLHAIRDWIVGSPHTVLQPSDFAGFESEREWSNQYADERVEVLRILSQAQDWAAAKYTKLDTGLEWVTTVTFSRQVVDSWVGIRVSCESRHPSVRLPRARKPVVVRTLLKALGGAADGLLKVGSEPHSLENVDIDIAARLISGTAGCRLPIVYVSAGFRGDYILDPDKLARELSGMAHVVVEPNRAFSLRLKQEVESANVFGGTIGIYWPGGGGRRSFFPGGGESTVEVHRSVVGEVTAALANRRPLDRCTWAGVQALVSRHVFEELRAAGSQEVERYAEEFDKELHAKADQLEDAEREIQRLQAEIRKYEHQIPMGSGLMLQTGQEQDLYPGELLGIVRDALHNSSIRVLSESRRGHILSAILSVNASSGVAERMREELKQLLRGATGLDSKARRGLERMGFAISEDGKHYKLVFQGDDRYTFTLPKSGSDHRGGLNAAGDISRHP